MRRFFILFILMVAPSIAWAQNIKLFSEELDRKSYAGQSFEVAYECASDDCQDITVQVYVNGTLQNPSSEKGARPGRKRFMIKDLPDNRSGKTHLKIDFVKDGQIVASYPFELDYRPVEQHSVFLGIAVGDFDKESGIPALRWPVNDIWNIKQTMTRQLDGDCTSFTNVHKEGVLGKRDEIRKLFDDVDKYTQENKMDVVYVYLSGHGKQEEGEWYFFTEDTSRQDLRKTALSGADVRDYLRKLSRYARVYLFVDACESAALYSKEDPPSNMVFYASSGADEASIEEDGNSAFTSGVLSVFTGEEYQANEINVKGLFNVITKVVNRKTHNRQNPVLMPSDRYTNDVVFKIRDLPQGLLTSEPVRGAIPALMSIVPGGGQLYKGDYLKAGLMFGGCALGAGGIVLCEMQRQNLIAQASQTHDINNIKILSSQAQNMATARTALIVATAALYVYNIADAAFFAGKKHNIQVMPTGVKVTF